MITIKEAISLIKNTPPILLEGVINPIIESEGYTLFKNIDSPINMPPFRQSAMDGFAINLHKDLSYNLIGELKAGDGHKPILKPGEAIRIFTGSAVPDSANAVIMQEKVKVDGNKIKIEQIPPKNHNIRALGEQVKKGEVALKKGTKLTPAAIGYLTSLGITQVFIFKKPNIAIVTTGNELIEAEQDLSHGKIYESNSKMLLSALYNLKLYNVTLYKVEDDYNKTVKKLNAVINDNHLVLITGGISVGDYDYVGKALHELQVEKVFYKVKQKPGKPLFYGKKKDTQIFALPGNPAAALSCFYVYVYIALQKMMNYDALELPRVKAKSISNFDKKGNRPQFLKAIYNNNEVEILEGQNSSMLQTFAVSNALVYLPEENNNINIGNEVDVIILPT